MQGMHAITSDPATLALFHQLVHQSQKVQIGSWQVVDSSSEGCRSRRTLTYTQPVRGPVWFRRLCGAHLPIPRVSHSITVRNLHLGLRLIYLQYT